MLESSDKLVPEALHAIPKTAPMHSHAPPCYIPYRSPSAQELMSARWKVMGPHVLPYHPTASHNAPSSSRVCKSHGPWADIGWHGRCMVRYGRPWACMGPHGSSDVNSPFSECVQSCRLKTMYVRPPGPRFATLLLTYQDCRLPTGGGDIADNTAFIMACWQANEAHSLCTYARNAWQGWPLSNIV